MDEEAERTCVVIDDLCLEGTVTDVAELGRLFSMWGGKHTLVVTTRLVSDVDVGWLRHFTSVEAEDLKFSRDEVDALLGEWLPESERAETVDRVTQLAGGQAALLGVMAKHLVMGAGEGAGLDSRIDLRSLLTSLAESQLTVQESEALVALSILGTATLRELGKVREGLERVDLVRISRCIPLVQVTAGRTSGLAQASVHALAQEVYASSSFAEAHVSGDMNNLLSSCVTVLEDREEYSRVVPLLAENLPEEELADWLLTRGSRAVAAGHADAVGQAVDTLTPTVLLSHPRLLLMSAEYGEASSDVMMRAARATAAADLARCEGDTGTLADALLAKAEAAKDMGRIRDACLALQAVKELPEATVGRERAMLTAARLITYASGSLDQSMVAKHQAEVRAALLAHDVSLDVEARLRAQLGVAAFLFGRINESVAYFSQAAETASVPVLLRAMILGDLATVLMEMGRFPHASSVLNEHHQISEGFGLETYRASGDCTRACIGYFEAPGVALETMADQLEILKHAGDRLTEAHVRLYRASLLRASGRVDDAMADIEVVLRYAANQDIAYHQLLAEVELAANFLALGDDLAAVQHASRVREECSTRGAAYHVMRADIVLAEAARRCGRLNEGVNRFLEHEEYILEGAANFAIAVYSRAFPAVIPMVAAALGAESLPAHLLRMLSDEDADRSLQAGAEILRRVDLEILSSRLLGARSSEWIAALDTTPPCRVRLFGGLEVRVGGREVAEGDWRKRKARLLFAMLVLQYGTDVSREAIYEHLWPEMDESRARNNLYVIWSAMKAALEPGGVKGASCPYVSHKGGVCRISTTLVHSDVAEFDRIIAEARAAESAGDAAAALRGYEMLVDVYRGELLPGDAYDDWFSTARDRYRQEFGDAMLASHRILTSQGDHAAALRMIRRAIGADGWREDLYQAMLRSQISMGQRGAAVDTYLACRTRLAEDLGLDPSRETVTLYEQVLAMEEGPGGPRPALD